MLCVGLLDRRAFLASRIHVRSGARARAVHLFDARPASNRSRLSAVQPGLTESLDEGGISPGGHCAALPANQRRVARSRPVRFARRRGADKLEGGWFGRAEPSGTRAGTKRLDDA